MALTGNAFLAIWHDIAAGAHDEYIEWHTREHMPERLSIPGFTVGKRLHNPGLGRHVFGTIYAGDEVEVFRSPAYLERLNNPTPWTAAVAPSFQNFLRVACDRLASRGRGDGGSMATLRLDHAGADSAERLRAGAGDIAERILALRGVSAVHVGAARSEVSGTPTRETELRAPMAEKGFDAVILIEGASRPGLEAAMAAATAIAAEGGALVRPEGAVYDAAYTLTAAQMAR